MPDTETRTEAELQDALYSYFGGKNHPVTVPNCGAGCVMGEADLISVTQAHYVHEVEIKRSREDFRRDFCEKQEKHEALAQGYRRERDWWNQPNEVIVYANYFWFAAPPGVLDEFDIPEYAGYFIINDDARVIEYRHRDPRLKPPTVDVEKKAPRLNTDKIDDEDLDYIARGVNARYWDTRTDNAYWQNLLEKSHA